MSEPRRTECRPGRRAFCRQAALWTGLTALEAKAPPPCAIHVLTTASQRPEWPAMLRGVLDLDYISGLLVYVNWSSLEPARGEFDWQLFDAPLELAGRKGKVAAFGLMVQAVSPAWVKRRCRTFTFEHIHPAVGTVASPVPWDPDYQAMLGETVRAIARRVDGRPALHYVAINGPSSLYGVETNFPVKKIAPVEAARLGYTHEKFESGWKLGVDRFAESFPKSRLSLGLHDQISLGPQERETRLRTVRAIRDHAIEVLERQGRRPMVRLLGLGPDNPRYFAGPYAEGGPMSDYVRLTWEVRGRADIGFEAARVFSRSNVGGLQKPLDPAEFERVLENGISHRPNWLEIKQPDVWDMERQAPYVPFARSIQAAHRRMQGR